MHLNDRRCPSQVYSELVASWIARNFTLRYTGGMVPDVHHILAKGGGVFCNPASAATPAKLRLVYECAPLAFIIEVGCRFNVLFPACWYYTHPGCFNVYWGGGTH